MRGICGLASTEVERLVSSGRALDIAHFALRIADSALRLSLLGDNVWMALRARHA